MTPTTGFWTALNKPIDTLSAIASNLYWTWDRRSRELLSAMPGSSTGVHPLQVIHAADTTDLGAWVASRSGEIEKVNSAIRELETSVGSPEIAYFSPEFGIAAEVPQYSGGLGILAGDHLKAASDISLPLIGIGLLYRQGFFRQEIESDGQHERYERVNPDDIGAIDTGHRVTVPISGSEVVARVWKQMVGATTLLLLDTDHPDNSPDDRQITDRLYSGDRRHRLHQELVLGVGGVRALRSLGLEPHAFHLNEGHACFLLLELLAERVEDGLALDEAVEWVRSSTLFTTHTPVPAGIDTFSRKLVTPELKPWAKRIGVPVKTILGWAEMPAPGRAHPFNTAALAFELCGRANGVSQLHSSVSRRLFAAIPRAAAVEGITNGVHARTWVSREMQDLYDQYLGPEWENGSPEAWSNVSKLDPEAFASAHKVGRRRLADLVSESAGIELDPDGCVIGFARRFATYKRATLLLRDEAGLQRALDGGAQFVFAGKAHPADTEGKAVLAEIARFARSREAQGRFVFLADYDISVADAMYGGCDVWLNNPIRPHEACGTSGEKAALNGALNCSILDGWWADWYTDGIGWAIPTSDLEDQDERDDAEAASLNAMLADQVLPTFREPAAWWRHVTAMLTHLGPKVTAGRMVREYDERFYHPISGR